MDIPRRQLVLALSAALCSCGPPPPPPAPADEKLFIRKPKIEIKVERKIVPDPETGRKNLIFEVKLVSGETLMELHDLRLQILVLGTNEPNPKKPELSGYWRMILNRNIHLSLMPGQSYVFESDLIESGEGDPWHQNYNVSYRGYVVNLENKRGETCARAASEDHFQGKRAEWAKTPEGGNFKP